METHSSILAWTHRQRSLAVCGPPSCRTVRLDLTTKQQQIDLTEMMKMRQNETPALCGNSDRRQPLKKTFTLSWMIIRNIRLYFKIE